MSVYPATNSNEAVELIIDGGNQLHDIINETADKTVTTESGEIPSVRKAIADSLMFLELFLGNKERVKLISYKYAVSIVNCIGHLVLPSEP